MSGKKKLYISAILTHFPMFYLFFEGTASKKCLILPEIQRVPNFLFEMTTQCLCIYCRMYYIFFMVFYFAQTYTLLKAQLQLQLILFYFLVELGKARASVSLYCCVYLYRGENPQQRHWTGCDGKILQQTQVKLKDILYELELGWGWGFWKCLFVLPPVLFCPSDTHNLHFWYSCYRDRKSEGPRRRDLRLPSPHSHLCDSKLQDFGVQF